MESSSGCCLFGFASAVARPEHRPSTFPMQEVLQESLNNHQWSRLWFTASLDGKLSLTPGLLQLFPDYKWHLLTSLPPRSSCSYPPGPRALWKLARSRKTSLSIGIKTRTGFLSLVQDELYVLQPKLHFHENQWLLGALLTLPILPLRSICNSSSYFSINLQTFSTTISCSSPSCCQAGVLPVHMLKNQE